MDIKHQRQLEIMQQQHEEDDAVSMLIGMGLAVFLVLISALGIICL